jgi:predicted nucleic acid-binding protein
VSFLLDTDICSAYLKGNNAVANRFIQYGGRLHVSAVSLGELYTWGLRANASPTRLRSLLNVLPLVQLLDVDADVSRKFGELDAYLLDRGLVVTDIDLLNAATAQVHDLTVVTHNVQDFVNVPGLQVVDWLNP